MAPEARSRIGALLFEPVFWKQMFCIEKSTGDMVGTFGHPAVILRPGIVPLSPRCAPDHTLILVIKS